MAHTSHGHGQEPPDVNVLAKLGYEPRDIALNTLSQWLLVLFVFIGVTTAISLLLYRLLAPQYAESEFSSPLQYVRRIPANPQLQTRPKRDMMSYWSVEDRVIKNYTPGDNGTVNLPISQAIDLMGQRGISGITDPAQPPIPDTRYYPGSGHYVTGRVEDTVTQGEALGVEHEGGTYSPSGGTGGVSGYFEGGVTPNPYIGGQQIQPPPSLRSEPAPGASQIGSGYSAQGIDGEPEKPQSEGAE